MHMLNGLFEEVRLEKSCSKVSAVTQGYIGLVQCMEVLNCKGLIGLEEWRENI